MSKSLVVVESPAKAKTINKFLGKNFIVKASVGHIRDLPKSKLGVDIENDFTPKYITIRGKGKVIKELKKTAKKTDKIYLAADPDREGEAICWHLAYVLRNTKKTIQRITFNEITKRAINKALNSPGEINQDLVDAQQARRILDRLVGYQISPILWRSLKTGLSAGRVQSVAVRLICEREEEIDAFEPQEYWSIIAKLKGKSDTEFEAQLYRLGKKKADIGTYGFLLSSFAAFLTGQEVDEEEDFDESQAHAIVEDAKQKQFAIKNVKRKERKRYPYPPFITSRLQQDAAYKLHFSAKKTMRIAQQLYEGIKVGKEGAVGLITYMRTDSTRIASEALDEARRYIKQVHGKKYLPSKPRLYKSKKGAQDAHEAIRPTSVSRVPKSIKSHLTRDQMRLYDLIWRRFIASQMNPAIMDVTTVNILAGDYLFRATGSIIKFDGFMAVYGGSKSKKDDKILPELDENEKLKLLELTPKQHFTKPPPRYTEATLVKELEKKDIGRPSTYASIISKIQDREYVLKEKGRFVPTDVGKMVNHLLIKSFPDIIAVSFTARMENKLDKIEDGKVNWVEVIKDFYKPFGKDLEEAADVMYEAKKELEEETDEVCDKCGAKMIVKWGKYGRFLACSNYPECENTKPYGEDDSKPAEQPTDEVCEKCGSPMVIRTNRYGGKFLACSAYPKCKNTKSISIGIDCPEEDCDGYLTERRTRKGKVFYGCSNYPDCEFSTWNKPVPKSCPKCGAPFLVEKTSKRRGKYLACINEDCDYEG